jgi:hypothetical protein
MNEFDVLSVDIFSVDYFIYGDYNKYRHTGPSVIKKHVVALDKYVAHPRIPARIDASKKITDFN